jgi:glc operon protein GlcG
MLTKPVLTVAETTKILDAARAEAEKNNWAPSAEPVAP